MSVSEKITGLADGFRGLYGMTDKLSFDDMRVALSGLQIHNFFDEGQSFEATFDKNWISQPVSGLTLDLWNKLLVDKTIIISCDAEWSGYVPGAAEGDRFFIEAHTTDANGQQHWYGLYYTPKTATGKQHLTTALKLSSIPMKTINDVVIYDELNSGSYLKLTNIKMVIDPIGGGKAEHS